MRWRQVYIPGYYLFHSRLKSKNELLSLLYVYPSFLFLSICLYFERFTLDLLFPFLLAINTWLSFYEIGYIENDSLTIRKEKNPTMRISLDLANALYSHILKVRLGKFGIGLLGLLGLFALQNTGIELHITSFIVAIILSRMAFMLHNKIRSRWNVLTYLSLALTKYLAILLLFIGGGQIWELVTYVFVLWGLPRTIEHAAKAKYKFHSLRWVGEDLDRFRVFYYAFVFLILIGFKAIGGYNVIHWIYGTVYMLFYRLGLFVLIRTGFLNRPVLKSHNVKIKDD